MNKFPSYLLPWAMVVLVCMSGAAAAQSTVHFNVTGRILDDATCDLSAGDVNRTVTLDTVRVSDFAGERAIGPKTFTITANCENASRVTFKFSGTPVPDGDLWRFQNTGTASGVALWLESGGVTIHADGTGDGFPVTVSGGVASLDITARYWSLGSPTTGTLKSQATVSITYQ
jgi:type 1 fimbria pilin